jgi:alkylation response protein AidB-like acyl-CoA dehydrogenase
VSAGELTALRESAREALEDLSPSAEIRRQMDDPGGWDAAIWRRLCTELGVAGLAVPEEFGGAGLSAVELGIVFEEAGRSLLCGPLLPVAGLAIPLLLLSDDMDAKARHLPGLCDGSLVATVATNDRDGRPALDGHAVTAVTDGNGTRLTGECGFVLDGARADLFLVPATEDGRPAVFAVEAGSPGLTVEPLVTLDLTRRQAHVALDGVRAVRVTTGDARATLDATADVARAMLACEQAGGASWCLDDAVSHARTRVQFGRPIGSFQATKQKAADLLIQVESARSAAIAAAQAAADHLAARGAGADPPSAGRLADLPALDVVASVAKVYCSDAYVQVAGENIQIHGGIGFTWEHDAHLYYKRAWTSRELLGRPEERIEALADHLAEPGRLS